MAAPFQIIQPETTYTGTPIAALKTGLPKTTQSLCPECTKLIDARIFEEDGRVIMEKTCARARRSSATPSTPTRSCT